MAEQTFDLAVVGANTVIGEAVIELLQTSKLPIGKLHLLSDKEHAGARIEYKGQYLPLEESTKFDFSRASIALFCVSAKLAAQLAPKAVKAGCTVVDTSAQFRLDSGVPLVVPEVNGSQLDGLEGAQIIASPDSIVVAMLLALAPLHKLAGLSRVNVVALTPVSSEGKEGVDALAGETVALLNMKEIKPKLFPRQMSFNVVPRVGELSPQGYGYRELTLQAESAKIMGVSVNVNATLVQVPVFYGDSLALHVETTGKITAPQACDLLQATPGITLYDQPKIGPCPTPVNDAVGKDDIFVGRVREDITHANGLDLWLVADNIRRGTAGNVIAILEYLRKNC